MLLQIRTDTFYSIEMTEQQIQELSLVFEGLQEREIGEAISRITGKRSVEYSGSAQRSSIHETVQTFRRAIAEHKKL